MDKKNKLIDKKHYYWSLICCMLAILVLAIEVIIVANLKEGHHSNTNPVRYQAKKKWSCGIIVSIKN
ncbi:hypothetical protein [Pantoea sp. Aalb]|uniref:hypothetical protein n=1 Tax=Pantoea sp. Aalb TaxID=2576762 RepID=UPI001327B79D|nr:hypothetical protein [Pantoea sp. Aalb]MXP67405.1 hypothetical protein [Pantoea sp. Aalb]